jgi:phosphatidate cytidylyltransferase
MDAAQTPGEADAHRAAEAAPAETPANPMLRIGVFTLVSAGVGLLLAVDSAWSPGYVYAAGGAAVVMLAMAEFADLARRAGVEVSRPLLVVAGATLFLLQWAGWAWPKQFADPWLCAVAVAGLAVMVPLSARVMRGRIEGALQSVSVTAAGLVYVPVLFGFLTPIRVNWGVWALITVVVVSKAGTSGAYLIGRTFGRAKLAPAVSPRKTVAGAAGQIFMSMAASYGLAVSPKGMMPPAEAVLYGALVGLMAMFGDLAESVLKRQARIKDSSHLMSALGGMLDTIDDLLFVAPVSYFVLLWCVPGVQGG